MDPKIKFSTILKISIIKMVHMYNVQRLNIHTLVNLNTSHGSNTHLIMLNVIVNHSNVILAEFRRTKRKHISTYSNVFLVEFQRTERKHVSIYSHVFLHRFSFQFPTTYTFEYFICPVHMYDITPELKLHFFLKKKKPAQHRHS